MIVADSFHYYCVILCYKMADSQTDTGTESDEFVEGEEKFWPPTRASRSKVKSPRYPRPHSNLFRVANKIPRGKFTRRVENCK